MQSPCHSPVLALLQQAAGPQYTCPGERHPVSRAVHLSRMAAYYPACRNCPHRDDAGALPPRASVEASPIAPPPQEESIFHRDGIRGVYLNQIHRPLAVQVGMAFAGLLWREMPREGRREEDELRPRSSLQATRSPRVVLGRDERASSPDITAGAASGLRLMGCRVVDVGCVSRPAIDFGVHHLQADGGLYVTGAGHPAAWTGFDIVKSAGISWSDEGGLAELDAMLESPITRPTRSGGTTIDCDLRAPHQTMFGALLHGLKPVRVGLISACVPTRIRATDSLADFPELQILPADAAMSPPTLARRRQLQQLLQEHDLQFLVSIADDGRCVSLVDEHGRLLNPNAWLVRLVEQRLRSGPSRAVVVPESLPAVTKGRLSALGAKVITTGASHEELTTRLAAVGEGMAADGQGRIWTHDHYPLCDGLATLAQFIRLAGATGEAVSEWAA